MQYRITEYENALGERFFRVERRKYLLFWVKVEEYPTLKTAEKWVVVYINQDKKNVRRRVK